MWAMKSYKTPISFNVEGYKIKGMSLKEPTKDGYKSKMPKAQFYIKPTKWSDVNSKYNMQRFQKSQRITHTDQILQTRKLKLPGPGTYKPQHNFKIYNPPKISTPQLVMLDEAKFRGKQTPGPIYNIAPLKAAKEPAFVGLHPYSRGF